MAEKDLSQKALQAFPDVFADIFNALLFKGEKVLDPDCLRQIETEGVALPDGGVWKQLYRDVFMEHTVTGVRYLILGIENQSDVDYTMPLRCMGIDYAAYEKQRKILAHKKCRTRGKQSGVQGLGEVGKLIPVITLVLYYGKKRWTGPRDLFGMLDLPGEKEYPGINNYIHNYGMNLISVGDLTEDEAGRFQSDFKYLIEYIRNYQDPERQLEILCEGSEAMDHATETMLALQALSKDRRFLQIAQAGEQREEKKMCKMLDILETRGEAKGTISVCREFGMSREEVISRLCEKMKLQEQEAVRYVELYWENA